MKLNKKYWEKRYSENEIGWDVGHITNPLKEYIDQLKDRNIKILIPGCGNGYEFEYLYQNGFKNIYVIDLAKQPLENLKKRIPNIKDEQLLQGDFFQLKNKFDLIIEQTFFCALSPEFRKNYVTQMNSLLKSKGKIVGLLFQFPLTNEGPPFGGSFEEYKNLFEIDYKIKKLEVAHNSIKPRENKELFFIFEKK